MSSLPRKPAFPAVNPGAYLSVVTHGATAGTARTAGATRVLWVGTVEPSNGTAADIYLDSATPALYALVGAVWTALGGGGGGLTTEQVQDIIGAMETDSSSVDFTYDDTAGTVTAIIKAGAVTEAMLSFAVATQAELDAVAAAKASLTGATFSGDVLVPDEAYDATAWNGSLEVPTKNALRDKIETLGAGGSFAIDAADAVMWVSGTGSDADDGLSIATPKLTLQAAYTALPATGGTIFVGIGRYDVGAGWNLTRGKPVSLIGLVKPPPYIVSTTTAPLSVAAAIIYTSTNAASLITTTAGTAGSRFTGLRFENLLFELSGTATATALDVDSCTYGTVTGCYFFADKTTGPAPVTAQGMFIRGSATYGDNDASWWRVTNNQHMNMALGTFGNPTGTKYNCNQQVIRDNIGLGLTHLNTSALPFISIYGGHRCVVRDNNIEAYYRGILFDNSWMCVEDGDGGEYVDFFVDLVGAKGCKISPLGISYAGLGNNSATTPYLQDAKLVRGDAFTKACILILPTTWDAANTQRLYQPTDDPTHPSIVMGSTDNYIVSSRNITNRGQRDLVGTGTPEGAVVGNIGDTFRRTDGGANTTLYVKESGTGNTGWVAYGAAVTGAVTVTARTSDAAAIASSTTLTADGVLKFALGATEMRFFDAFILVNAANATMDLKVGLSGPASFTASWGNGDIAGATGVNPGFYDLATSATPAGALGAGGVVTLPTAAQLLLVHVSGWVTGGGTAGDVALTFAQNTSDAGNLVIKKGSHIKHYAVA